MVIHVWLNSRVRSGALATNIPELPDGTLARVRHNGVSKVLEARYESSYSEGHCVLCPWDFGYFKRYPGQGKATIQPIKEDYPRED